MILGLNGVVVARHGLILWENDATGVRKVFRYLPGLRDHRKKMKIHFPPGEIMKIKFSRIFPYILI